MVQRRLYNINNPDDIEHLKNNKKLWLVVIRDGGKNQGRVISKHINQQGAKHSYKELGRPTRYEIIKLSENKMDKLHGKVAAWQKARASLLENLSKTEVWMKSKGKGFDVVEPSPFMQLWTELSNAESELFNYKLPNPES